MTTKSVQVGVEKCSFSKFLLSLFCLTLFVINSISWANQWRRSGRKREVLLVVHKHCICRQIQHPQCVSGWRHIHQTVSTLFQSQTCGFLLIFPSLTSPFVLPQANPSKLSVCVMNNTNRCHHPEPPPRIKRELLREKKSKSEVGTGNKEAFQSSVRHLFFHRYNITQGLSIDRSISVR